ncbi:hypothetical protein BDN72DRAFT_965026 [Pluteus cervinus]|uniref:Uncharacterized protein n=1 Tax=Pluteus cervinus TaxID=181527 RepID=A0ACD3A817_9AGAR|nr:hypothetical protein BDN72DRAFT_965026 [Pluteus cervinus]
MNDAHALPEELWTHIFKYLPHEDLKTMSSVDSVLRTYVGSMIWRRLTVCSLLPENIKNAKLILENPYLARQITSLRLHPVHYIAADQEEAWTSLWVIAPTFWSVLKHFKWAHPVLSWRYYRRSIEDIRVSTKVVPLLTHLREITVVPFFHRRRSYIPPVAPYRAIWAGLRTEYLQRLNLRLWKPGSIQMISEAMRSTPPVVFASLQTLTLDLGMEQSIYPKLQEDLRTILDCGRSSLRSFGITFCTTDSHYAEIVGAFGIFPNLSQFLFQASFLQYDQNAQLLRQVFLPFFLQHQSTLRKLHLSMLPISSPFIWSIFGDHDDNANVALKLEAFTFRYHFPDPFRDEQPVQMPRFRMFADTLTCLVLVPIFDRDSEGLYFDDVKVLLGSLRLSNRSIGLKRLWIRLMALSPELLDLMAESLTNLEKLKVCHRILVGEKDRHTDDKGLFLEKMNSRFYPQWELRHLDVKSWSAEDRIPADYLKKAIPSLREVGSIDLWNSKSDLRVRSCALCTLHLVLRHLYPVTTLPEIPFI